MIKFAGIQLLNQDPEGNGPRFIEKYLDPRQVSLFGDDTTAYAGLRHAARQGCKAPIGLPRFNYPPRPPLKINQLYWPTGATRWASGMFLASDVELQAILPAIQNTETENPPDPLPDPPPNLEYTEIRSGLLEFGEASTGGPISAKMFLLPPKPISSEGLQNRMWLLPLVDERYFWQWRSVEEFKPATWASGLNTLLDALGVDTSSFLLLTGEDDPVVPGGADSLIDENWGKPHSIEFNRSYENAAILLDGMLASIGRRFTRQPNGDLIAPTVAMSALASTNNLGRFQEIAGGVYGGNVLGVGANVPEKVAVVFRTEEDEPRTIEKTFRETFPRRANNAFVPGLKKTFWTTAEYEEPVFDYELLQFVSTSLSLVDLIAESFYGWQLFPGCDRTFHGCAPWFLTGAEDCVIWDLGCRIPRSSLLTYHTRVHWMPPNVGTATMLQQFKDPSECQSSTPGLALAKGNPVQGNGAADLREIVNVPVLPLRTVASVEPPAITNYVLMAPREFLGSFPPDWEFVIYNPASDLTTPRLRADCLASELQPALRTICNSTTLEVFGKGSAGDTATPDNPWGTNPPLSWPLGVFFVRDEAANALDLKTLLINKGWRAAGVPTDKWFDLTLRELRLWPRDVKPLDLEGIVAINSVTSPRELVMYSGKFIQQWDKEFV